MLKYADTDTAPWVRFSFRLRPDQLDQIKQQAREDELTASAYVRRALKKAMADKAE